MILTLELAFVMTTESGISVNGVQGHAGQEGKVMGSGPQRVDDSMQDHFIASCDADWCSAHSCKY